MPHATAGEKAVAMCWIMHLTGDIHQPLHATSLFTTEYPGERRSRGHEIHDPRQTRLRCHHLHRFWDDLILGSDRFQDVKNRASKFAPHIPRDQLPELAKHVEPSDIQKWAEESLETAKTAVYREGKITGSPDREKRRCCPTITQRPPNRWPSTAWPMPVTAWPMCSSR